MCKDQDYIVRIISIDELKKHIIPTAGERSTFHLRSAISYRDLPANVNGDPDEMHCVGKNFTAIESNNYLISCWTYLGNNLNPDNLFKQGNHENRNDIAIISTIKKMNNFLRENIYEGMKKLGLFASLEHKKVNYYKKEQIQRPKNHEKELEFLRNLPFQKEEKFSTENEYRFAIRETELQKLHSLIFFGNPKDYIEAIYINKEKFTDNQGIIAALLSNNLSADIFKNSQQLKNS